MCCAEYFKILLQLKLFFCQILVQSCRFSAAQAVREFIATISAARIDSKQSAKFFEWAQLVFFEFFNGREFDSRSILHQMQQNFGFWLQTTLRTIPQELISTNNHPNRKAQFAFFLAKLVRQIFPKIPSNPTSITPKLEVQLLNTN